MPKWKGLSVIMEPIQEEPSQDDSRHQSPVREILTSHDGVTMGAERSRRNSLTMERARFELMDDVNDYHSHSIVAKLWANHLYTTASAALYLGKSIVCWTDEDEQDLRDNPGCCKFSTGRIWFDGHIKRRPFYGFKLHGLHFGLSPSVQQLDVLRDTTLSKLGLVLEKQRYKWQSQGGGSMVPISTLRFDIDKMIQEPYRTNLCYYLDGYCYPDMSISNMVLANICGLQAPEKFPDIYDDQDYDSLMVDFMAHPNYKRTTYYYRRETEPDDI